MKKDILKILLQIILSGIVILISVYAGFLGALILASEGYWTILCILLSLAFPSLFLPIIWVKKRARYLKFWCIFGVMLAITFGVNYTMKEYDKKITVNVTPNINTEEYLPFSENSKIVKRSSQTLKLTENLPIVDGAAAVFPVYSAFVNAVYPESTTLYNDVFKYNNTVGGYKLLAEKETDIFFGAYPSEEQISYAKECGTTFRYIPIGSEAFVFFVHKDNPVTNLTSDQIRSIYAGEITNWREVGGKNEAIAAFQRNEGSGSQSQLKRFMGDKPLMEPPTEMVNDLMSGIIERVSNYKSKTNSIGFSFRYYVEGIIQNPDIKLLSIDGVAPTVENIKNGNYPLVGELYAVTYEENENGNVKKLLNWVLSQEGQEIIEETGYAGIH